MASIFRKNGRAAALVLTAVCGSSLAFGQRLAVEAPHGVVTSAHYLASQAGVEILKKGGNAVDAAVATGIALEVVYPFAGNLGGGGFMMIHKADGTNAAIDFREEAPAAASHDMYLDKNGDLIKGKGGSVVGWRASGVPGTVAGYALAFQKYGSGKVTWAEVVEPARRLAAEGVEISTWTARSLKNSRNLVQFPESKRIYLNDGAYYKAGDIMKQPELAATLERLQKNGPREFYEGETAHKIAEAMQANGGTITLDDLKEYHAVDRTPLTGSYRGYTVVTMPPPSSGGVVVLQMLAMLEPFDVHAMGSGSAAKIHLFTEVMRRAFLDRNTYLGDPDFIKNPIAGMLDPAYVKGLMANYDPNKATPSATLHPGKPAGYELVDLNRPGGKPETKETTHFDTVDADGNAVSSTYTLNGGYGSGVTIPGTGLLMNNEMDDFASKPGSANMFGLVQGEANSIAPHKRPLSSMTPTFVLKDGKLFLATGSPGGPTIINTTIEIITNVIDHGMPAMQAVEAPRFHHQWMPDLLDYEINGFSPDTVAILKSEGHILHPHLNFEGAYQGDGETIEIDPQTGMRLGASDPRRADGRAVGY